MHIYNKYTSVLWCKDSSFSNQIACLMSETSRNNGCSIPSPSSAHPSTFSCPLHTQTHTHTHTHTQTQTHTHTHTQACNYSPTKKSISSRQLNMLPLYA